MRKVAIVARSPSTRFRAPFHDKTWEIWNLSPQGQPHFTDLPRWDRWYEIHHLNEKEVECPGYIDFLKLYGNRVYLREAHPELPDAQVYPLAEVIDFCGKNFVNEMRYYNNTVSLMMAHAFTEGNLAEVGLFGVDMAQCSEYAAQRPSCELFCGLLAGAGIKVTVPDECDLLKCQRIYGIEDAGPWERKLAIHEKELEEKLHKAHQELNECKKQMVGAAAAHGELSKLVESLNGQATSELMGAVNTRLGSLEQINDHNTSRSEQLDDEIKMFTGALEECRYQRQFT